MFTYLSAALVSAFVFGAVISASAQTEIEDSKRPLTYTAPTAAEKAKEPKQSASANIEIKNYDVQTFDYLRINRPDAIVALARDVRAGRTPQSVLDRAVTPELKAALLKSDMTREARGGRNPQVLNNRIINPAQPIKFNNVLAIVGDTGPTKVTAPTMEFGSFSVGGAPTLRFAGVAKKEGVVKVDNIGQTGNFKVARILSYTGKLVPSKLAGSEGELVPEIDQRWSITTKNGGPAQIQVKAGQPYAVVVYLGSETNIGDYSGKLSVTDPTTVYTVPMHAKIDGDTRGATAFVSYGEGTWLAAGRQAIVTLTLTNLNTQPATITIPQQDLAAGVTVAANKVTVPANGKQNLNLTLTADKNAPELRGFPVSINASNDRGAVNAAKFDINVALPLYTWHYELHAGKVTSQNDVSLAPNGTWVWEAHQHDASTWYGDTYALALNFNKGPKPAQKYGYGFSGELGAKYSGPARNDYQHASGQNPWLEANYGPVGEQGIHLHLHVEDDPFSLAPYLKKWFEDNKEELVKLAPLLAGG